MNEKANPNLLTKEQVCAMLRVSPRTVGYMKAQGRFPKGVRIGKRDYWEERAVVRWQSMQCESQLAWLPIAA